MLEDIHILYFGSSKKDITQISNGKFLTTFKSIAACFAIDLNDCYGDLNKKYTSINWSFDQWQKSEQYLNKQIIPEKIKINTNAKEWIKTSGNSIGYLYSIEVDNYILNHLEVFNQSDPKWEIIYTGKKKIPVKLVKKLNLKWTCEYSKSNSNTHGFAKIGAQKYQKPYGIEILKEKYPKLLKDPVHKWRAKTGIELIHKEPDFQEQKRIFYNWIIMPKKLQEESDKKSESIFHCTNLENHNWIMENEWHDQNYFQLNDIRMRYDKRDMEENGLKYIHISKSNKSLIMKPRIPKNFMNFKGDWKIFNENNTIPRICCSNSIFGAISAIKINEKATYYVHLLEPKKVINNKEVARYVPDAIATGECWILDDQIKTKIIGKIEIGSLLPYTYVFLKDKKYFKCVLYHDYTFYPYESLFKRTYRKITNQLKN